MRGFLIMKRLLLVAFATSVFAVSACASGSESIATAFHRIQLGEADVVVAGGAEAAIHPLPIAAFAANSPMISVTWPFCASMYSPLSLIITCMKLVPLKLIYNWGFKKNYRDCFFIFMKPGTEPLWLLR